MLFPLFQEGEGDIIPFLCLKTPWYEATWYLLLCKSNRNIFSMLT